MPKLQVLNGKRQGEVFEIPHNTELVVGHRQSASISIDDPWISWDHARVIFQPDNATCWIEDLGSTNGTYVNCVRVKREQLRHEDIIFLGKTHVIYLSPISGDLFGLGGDGTGKHTAVGTPAVDAPLLTGSEAHGSPFEDSSETGTPFSSTGGIPPLQGVGKDDPFASRSSQNTVAPLWDPAQAKDPFSESSVDPFSSGPDYAGPGSGNLTVRPNNNPFAETRGDEQPNPLGGGKGGSLLSLSSLGELDDLNLPGPSGEEISRLIEGGDSDPFREIPGVERQQSTMKLPAAEEGHGETTFPTSRPAAPADPFDNIRPSEMRTQPINTDAINQMLKEHSEGPGAPAPPPPAPAPPAVLVPPQAPLSGAAPPPPPPTPSSSGDPSALAFEKARLEDEVHRLRLALQAVQQQNPQAVAAAARELRDAELGRMAQRIAELEREFARERGERKAREEELNLVTEEMIEKEDLIDSLRDQLGLDSGSGSNVRPPVSASDLGPGLVTPSSGDLPALSDSQDWSSLEF